MIQEPTQLTPTPGAGSRRSTGVKLGLLIVAVILLAIPVVMAMAANSPSLSPDKVLVAGASASPDAMGEPENDDGKRHGPQGVHGLGGPRGPGNGGGKGPITIHAISGNQISLATEDGWTRTITATGDTVISKGGVTIAIGDLKVGDKVGFRQTRNADDSYTIAAIVVQTARAGGEVTAIDGNGITFKARGGTTRVIIVTGSTVYKLGPTTASKSDVKVGTDIDAQGTVSGDTFTAISISIRLAHAGGEVTAKTSDSITVQNRDGSKTVIHVTSSTIYKGRGQATDALADIAVGDRVNADGTLRADGSLDAVSVHHGPAKGARPPKAPTSSTTPG